MNENCQEQSLCLEGITIYRAVESNNIFDKVNLNLSRFLEKGLIHYQEVDHHANVLFDSKSVYKPKSENLTILDSDKSKPKKRRVKDAE